MKEKTILIIEDDKDYSKSIKLILEDAGFKVLTASDGEDGLMKAEVSVPDLILLDIMLPKKDGFYVCHELKKNMVIKNVPVLVLTSLGCKAEGQYGPEKIARGHGADEYLEKPVDPQVLIEKVKSLINQLPAPDKEIKQTVLLVDDDPDFIASVKLLLDEKGYKTSVAYTGEEGLAMAKDQNPDIILLDVMLPEMDGYTVCQSLKEDKNTKFIPVLFLTSVSAKMTDPEYGKVLAVTHHGDDYIEKPVEGNVLLKRIRKYIGPARRLV